MVGRMRRDLVKVGLDLGGRVGSNRKESIISKVRQRGPFIGVQFRSYNILPARRGEVRPDRALGTRVFRTMNAHPRPHLMWEAEESPYRFLRGRCHRQAEPHKDWYGSGDTVYPQRAIAATATFQGFHGVLIFGSGYRCRGSQNESYLAVRGKE